MNAWNDVCTALRKAPKLTKPSTRKFVNNRLAEARYSVRSRLCSASAPAVLNRHSTAIAVMNIGTDTPIATHRHSNPTNSKLPIAPPSRKPIIAGLAVLPICAPVRCADIATPRRLGYRAANVPKAGACHMLVPKPTTAIASAINHTQGLIPIKK